MANERGTFDGTSALRNRSQRGGHCFQHAGAEVPGRKIACPAGADRRIFLRREMRKFQRARTHNRHNSRIQCPAAHTRRGIGRQRWRAPAPAPARRGAYFSPGFSASRRFELSTCPVSSRVAFLKAPPCLPSRSGLNSSSM